MAHLEQYLVETPCGEKFKVFAANQFDAGKQVMQKIGAMNSLVKNDPVLPYRKKKLA